MLHQLYVIFLSLTFYLLDNCSHQMSLKTDWILITKKPEVSIHQQRNVCGMHIKNTTTNKNDWGSRSTSNLHAHGHHFCASCMRMLLFAVCMVSRCVSKVGDILQLLALDIDFAVFNTFLKTKISYLRSILPQQLVIVLTLLV